MAEADKGESWRHGTTVPLSAIPDRSFGISGRMLTPGEIEAQDPFGGTGLRLLVPAGRIMTPADVLAATGISSCSVTVSSVWVCIDGDDTPETVRHRWESYLAREETGASGSA